MPTPLEAEIGAQLRATNDPTAVADELLERWHRNLLTESEQIDCAQFLLAAGLDHKLFEEIPRLIAASGRIPWAQFTEALGRSGLKIDEFEIQAVFDAAQAQDAAIDLLRARSMDRQHERFSELRSQLQEGRIREINERRQSMLDKIQYLRANRMIEQEGKMLDEYEALFPGDVFVREEREALKLRWAREVVANSTSSQDLISDLDWKIGSLTPEQTAVKTMLVEQAKALAGQDPRLAYDLAIGLHLMDFSQDALDILALAPESFAADWLRLELMIRARKFVDAMEEATRLEVTHAADPEAAFAALYARARALHGLGQVESAVELLRSLVGVRPHYKSAQSLLADWDKEET